MNNWKSSCCNVSVLGMAFCDSLETLVVCYKCRKLTKPIFNDSVTSEKDVQQDQEWWEKYADYVHSDVKDYLSLAVRESARFERERILEIIEDQIRDRHNPTYCEGCYDVGLWDVIKKIESLEK